MRERAAQTPEPTGYLAFERLTIGGSDYDGLGEEPDQRLYLIRA